MIVTGQITCREVEYYCTNTNVSDGCMIGKPGDGRTPPVERRGRGCGGQGQKEEQKSQDNSRYTLSV